jgi:uncharacterized protein
VSLSPVDEFMRDTAVIPPSPQQRLIERTRPSGPVVMFQRWEHLAFLHWRYEPAVVQATLPAGLHVDTWSESAWVGLVPLFMHDVRPRFVPAIPALSDFLELNLRTYVYDSLGRPGIYFYSLDCDQPIAVESARRLLHLRYEHCVMQATATPDPKGWVKFEAQRVGASEKATFRYQPFGPIAEPAVDSLEFFLIERYRLFTSDSAGEQLGSIRVCHAPYRIRSAHLAEWSDAPLRQAGLAPPLRDPDHLCAAEPVEVETFAPEKL